MCVSLLVFKIIQLKQKNLYRGQKSYSLRKSINKGIVFLDFMAKFRFSKTETSPNFALSQESRGAAYMIAQAIMELPSNSVEDSWNCLHLG